MMVLPTLLTLPFWFDRELPCPHLVGPPWAGFASVGGDRRNDHALWMLLVKSCRTPVSRASRSGCAAVGRPHTDKTFPFNCSGSCREWPGEEPNRRGERRGCWPTTDLRESPTKPSRASMSEETKRPNWLGLGDRDVVPGVVRGAVERILEPTVSRLQNDYNSRTISASDREHWEVCAGDSVYR
jgi:hypothetical protein